MYIRGGTVCGKKLTLRFFTHGSGRARTAAQFKSDNASVIWFVINNRVWLMYVSVD